MFFSTISIVLAALAIIISIALNPKQPNDVKFAENPDKDNIVLPTIKQSKENISESDSITEKNLNDFI